MLHGLGGHRYEWIVYGLINVADRAIRTGDIPPLIIVLPQGDKDYWVTMPTMAHVGASTLRADLVRHIDGTYRTLRYPSARRSAACRWAVGARYQCFPAPERLRRRRRIVSLRPEETAADFLGKGDEFASKDPVALARSLPGLGRLKIWIDMPAEDPWLERAELLHGILAGRGIEHLWQVNSGGARLYLLGRVHAGLREVLRSRVGAPVRGRLGRKGSGADRRSAGSAPVRHAVSCSSRRR